MKVELPPVLQAAYIYVPGANNAWPLNEGTASPCRALTKHLISAMKANVR